MGSMIVIVKLYQSLFQNEVFWDAQPTNNDLSIIPINVPEHHSQTFLLLNFCYLQWCISCWFLQSWWTWSWSPMSIQANLEMPTWLSQKCQQIHLNLLTKTSSDLHFLVNSHLIFFSAISVKTFCCINMIDVFPSCVCTDCVDSCVE